MKIASKNHVFAQLERYHLIAKKGYGQNFLINEEITKGIVRNSSIDKEDTILEIGPGLGALTEELLDNFRKVIAVEIDKNMVNVLKDTFANKPLTIIENDFLKIDLEEVLSDVEGNVSIVSNLPYYITSDILEKIILSRDKRINKIVVMMQKEVGNKLLKYDDHMDTVLKFLINNYCDVRKVLYVSKNDFIPRPNVDSIVLKLSLVEERNKINDEKQFFKVLKDCFSNKRKFLMSNLANITGVSRETLVDLYKKHDIKETVRIEEIDIKTFVELVNELI